MISSSGKSNNKSEHEREKAVWVSDELPKGFKEPRHYEQFKAKLEENSHYFCSWANGVLERLDSNQQEEFIVNVFQSVPKLQSELEIESFGKSKKPFLEVGVAIFVEFYFHVEVTRRRVECCDNWAQKANFCNEGGKKFGHYKVIQGFMDREYLPGIEYLHRWGSLHVMIRKGSCPESDLSTYDGEVEFKQLPNKSQAFVVATECFFWSALRTIRPDGVLLSMAALRKVVELDPRIYEWNYHLANWLRLLRKSTTAWRRISNEEIRALWESYVQCECDEIEARGRAYFGVLLGLAELLRLRSDERITDTPVVFDGLVLENDQMAWKYILEGIESHLEDPNRRCQFNELIRAGEILSSLVPFEKRDYKAAEKYYIAAWELKPTNGKANHKLGSLYSTCKELQDIPKALKYLRNCYFEQKNNIPRGLDLVQTLLASPTEKISEAIVILEELTINPFLKQTNWRAQLLLLRGAVEFKEGNKNAALNLWISCEQLNCEAVSFSSLPFSMRRFGWTKLVQFPSVVKAVDDYLGQATDEERTPLLKIRHVAYKASKKPQGQRNAGKRESDGDTNWRSPRERQNSPSTYQVPPRRLQQTSNSQNEPFSRFPPRNSFQNNSRSRRGGYQASSIHRSPSPNMWRQ